ncbi:MAG: GSCFA domain-containing protein [Saprospiraceae bacterium]|nr:GSCFA domain-containing protein [Saprospiraceae bacterium]
MTSLYTEVRVFDSKLSIGREDVLLTIGSCFADHIGQFFQKYKFKVLANPLGIVFNPYSLSQNLTMATSLNLLSEHEQLIVEDDGMWHSLLHHSTFSRPAKPSLINHLNQAIATTRAWLSEADYIIITLGSAHVYRHLSSGRIVSNCHKLPGAQFSKELLSIDTIESCLHRCSMPSDRSTQTCKSY